MTREGMTAFDIPNEMRNFAEKSMEQMRATFDSFVSATQHAVNTAQSQAMNAHTGGREVGELAMRFAEHNVVSSFQFAQRLLQAKDAQEIAKFHTEYVNSQMSTLAEQAKELSQKAARIVAPAATL